MLEVRPIYDAFKYRAFRYSMFCGNTVFSTLCRGWSRQLYLHVYVLSSRIPVPRSTG
jgi:hypothetical protein